MLGDATACQKRVWCLAAALEVEISSGNLVCGERRIFRFIPEIVVISIPLYIYAASNTRTVNHRKPIVLPKRVVKKRVVCETWARLAIRRGGRWTP